MTSREKNWSTQAIFSGEGGGGLQYVGRLDEKDAPKIVR